MVQWRAVNPIDTSVPIPLTDYLSAIGAVVGILLAALAIWITRRQRIKAIREATQERRTVFELEVLGDLMAAASEVDFSNAYRIGYLEYGRIAMLPADELPFWRLMVKRDRDKIRKRLDELGIPNHAHDYVRIRVALLIDVHAAIERRIDGRPGRAAAATAVFLDRLRSDRPPPEGEPAGGLQPQVGEPSSA
jgi:hypothetical protein